MNINHTNKTNYSLTAIIMHWAVAFIFILLFSSGLYMTGLGYYDPLYTKLPYLHKSFGLLLSFLYLYKLIFLLKNKPAPLPTHKEWEVKLSKVIHLSLILLIISIIATGYFLTTSDGAVISFFGLFDVPSIMLLDETAEQFSGDWHYILSIIAAVLVSIHIAGALKHTFIDHDGTLMRMIKNRNNRN